MTKQVQFLLALCFTAFSLSIFAQTGTISGKIIDQKIADVVIGATVRLDEGGLGCSSDLDGIYKLQRVPVGKHKITVTYLGYATKTIGDIEVKENEAVIVDVSMEEAASTLVQEVVITATAKKESQTAALNFIKNGPTVAEVISSETIRRTPDRTTGEVIRRVSGATIQDNRFAVIRGLNDRYNLAMLNGALLSSTEPDRKAFSFDMFPSSLLDNLTVMKTASPDLPGEFAGGIIVLNTKDIPEENYLNISVSGGYNTATTFKPFLSSGGSGTDWLGFDNGARALPGDFPSENDFKNLSKTDPEKIRISKTVPNDWAVTENASAAPNTGFQIASGFVTPADRKLQFGSTLALTYSNQNALRTARRFDYTTTDTLFDFMDAQFRNNVLWGALSNSALKINNRHKLTFTASYSTNTTNMMLDREGRDIEQERYVRQTSSEYTENHLLTTRLAGEHLFGERQIKLSWGGNFNQISRDQPSLRRMFSYKNFDAGEGQPFEFFVPNGSANRDLAGRFYANLTENVSGGNVDLSIPFALAGRKQNVKIGGLYQLRERDFAARWLGFIRTRTGSTFDKTLLTLPADQIFAEENIRDKGFVLDEITNPTDRYDGTSTLSAAYLMFDNKIGDRVRLTWGARHESWALDLNAVDNSGAAVADRPAVSSLLPSANMTFVLNEKNQFRLSASQTVARPEFREAAPFSFPDAELNATVAGNPNLQAGKIFNADFRYELYPGKNQIFSLAAFYKKFDNPIEFTFTSLGAGTRIFTYQNIPSAQNYGLEMEIRKNFEFIAAPLENLSFFANAALIRSSLDLSNVSAYDEKRALQGQSPYIANAGLNFNHPGTGIGTTLVYNVIGDRVAQVGTVGYGDIYERHRNLLDFQISKKIGKKGEIKLNWSDILRPDFIFYQDNNRNHKYDSGEDFVMQQINLGSTISLMMNYKL